MLIVHYWFFQLFAKIMELQKKWSMMSYAFVRWESMRNEKRKCVLMETVCHLCSAFLYAYLPGSQHSGKKLTITPPVHFHNSEFQSRWWRFSLTVAKSMLVLTTRLCKDCGGRKLLPKGAFWYSAYKGWMPFLSNKHSPSGWNYNFFWFWTTKIWTFVRRETQ